MLTKIILENFKVFKERTEIDLTKTNYAFLPQNVADNGVLKGAVFVGANASGKSSVLEAIKLLLDLLLGELEQPLDQYVSFVDFREDEAPREMNLEYQFLLSGKKVSYSFSYKDGRDWDCFVNEELVVDGKLMVSRQREQAESYLDDSDAIFYDREHIADGLLFLRSLYFNTKFQGHELLKEWMQFLAKSVYYHQIDRSYSFYSLHEQPSIFAYLEKHGTEEFNDFLRQYGWKRKIFSVNYLRA